MIDDTNFSKDRFYEIEQRIIRHTDTLFDSVAARVQKLEKQVHELEQINKNVSDRSRELKKLMENPPSIDPNNLIECPYCSHEGEDLEEHMVECEKRESEEHEKFVREEGIVCGTTRLMRERAQASALISEIERHSNRLNAPLDRQIRELLKLIGFEDQKLQSMAERDFPEEQDSSEERDDDIKHWPFVPSQNELIEIKTPNHEWAVGSVWMITGCWIDFNMSNGDRLKIAFDAVNMTRKGYDFRKHEGDNWIHYNKQNALNLLNKLELFFAHGRRAGKITAMKNLVEIRKVLGGE